MIVDIRLVRLRDGRWRMRTARGTVTCTAERMPEEVRAMTEILVSPRSHGRHRWDAPQEVS